MTVSIDEPQASAFQTMITDQKDNLNSLLLRDRFLQNQTASELAFHLLRSRGIFCPVMGERRGYTSLIPGLLAGLSIVTLGGGGSTSLPGLMVSDNQRFLVTGDGQPFFWLGDTAWELFNRLTREEASLYLEDRAGKGFNVIMAVALAELDGLQAPNAYGHTPLIENDPTRPNVKDGTHDYWDHVDYIVNKAGELGMYIGFLPTWGDKWNTRWGVGPEIFTPASAEVYGRWIGQRYKDAGNIIWILGGDRPVDNDTHRQITMAMAHGLHEGDGGRYLRTFHPNGGESSSRWFHHDDWLDFNMMQSGHDRASNNYVAIWQDHARTPIKPVIDGEPAYEYPAGTVLPDNPRWRPRLIGEREVRRNAYWAVFAGAFGHVYGTHPVWQMYDEGRDPMWHVTTPWFEALDLPGATQLPHLKALMLSRPYLSRIPDQNLILAGQGHGPERVQATRDGTPGHNDATYVMVYFPEHRKVTILTETLAAATLRGWWFNPRTGKGSALDTMTNQSEMPFMPPTNVPGEDWVLVLDDASEGYSQPGSPS